jgi:glycosyltransferase involved in cell wall biosynthesis
MGVTVDMGIHQVVAGAAPRDAITTHVLEAQLVIQAMGFRSEVFADDRHIAPDLAGIVHGHREWGRRAREHDRGIVHYSIHSPAFDYVMDRAAASALHYHNVTPPQLLWRDAPALAMQCAEGLHRLGRLADRVVLTAADSDFNAREMEMAGVPPGATVGVLRGSTPVDRSGRGSSSTPTLLFVGRGVPNKCQYDLILAAASLIHSGVDVRLRLAGSWGGNEAYLGRCSRLIERLGIGHAVAILHSISDQQLAHEYATADVFVCLSDHEGYCVPLIEAMSAGLPIVGYDAGAVPETMGGAGILLDEKRPSLVAEAVLMALDGRDSAQMASARAGQLAHHSREAVTARLRGFISDFSRC